MRLNNEIFNYVLPKVYTYSVKKESASIESQSSINNFLKDGPGDIIVYVCNYNIQ